MRTKRFGLALALCLALAGLLWACVKEKPQVQVQGITNLDSLTLRDDLVVGKRTTLGSGGLALTGNLTMSNVAILNSKGAVTITDNLRMAGVVDDAGTDVRINDGALITGSLAVAGNVSDSSTMLRLNDSTLITGTLGVTGTIAAGYQMTVADNLTVTGACDLKSNIADSANANLRLNDNVLVTGTLGVSSQVNAANGVAATGNITAGADVDVAGNIFSTSGSVRINDPLIVTGSLLLSGPIDDPWAVKIDSDVIITGGMNIAGNFGDQGATLRLNDATLITGTLGVSSQINAAGGIATTGNMTTTGNLSVTAWSLLSGLVGEISSVQAITANYGITPTDQLIVYISDDGGQATDTVTLSAATSIVDGAHVGQLLIVVYVDTHGATMTIKDNANVQLPSNADLALGLNDSAWFLWNGTDWICIAATNT